MARSKEFDPQKALQAAMDLFWRKGYSATSIEDLVEHTGISRYGLYGTFGGKHELFLAALDLYRAQAGAALFAFMETPTASLAEIRQYFEVFVSGAGSDRGTLGCFVCNTALELAASDEDAAQRVAAYFAQMERVFRHALANAQQNKELPIDFDVDAYAIYLVGVTQGLMVFLRSSVEPDAVRQYVEVALSALP